MHAHRYEHLIIPRSSYLDSTAVPVAGACALTCTRTSRYASVSERTHLRVSAHIGTCARLRERVCVSAFAHARSRARRALVCAFV
eukprot:2183437-Pleurochrysis_carterae.AAC.1